MTNKYFEKAQRFIPGGVNSPVRAFGSVGGDPVFIASASGSRIKSQDGIEYIDYVGSWGPMILGHADPDVLAKVQETVRAGLSFGAPTVLETELAETICTLMPSIERVRMVNSGTEATMSAIRLARGFTDRPLIIKFNGCYHGHADSLLVKAGSGALTLGIPGSAGVPEKIASCTITCDYNEPEQLDALFERYGDQIAGVIVEPVAGNMNMILPRDGYLEKMRTLCDQHGSVLIFDEVMTGFRVARGGVQAIYNVIPDLTTLGKIVGGGMPVGAFGGREDIMAHIAPSGPVYQAGTLSGNPIGMAAGIVTLNKIQAPNFYPQLDQITRQFGLAMKAAADSHGVPFHFHQLGGMFGFFFSDASSITRFDDVSKCNAEHFQKFFSGMLERGHYFAPSAYEAGFTSAAHSEVDFASTVEAASDTFRHF